MTTLSPRLPVWLCLSLAFFAWDARAAAPMPYAWLPQDTHDVRAAAKPDALDIETTGSDPWVAFSPRAAVDPQSQSVLAFEYFCPEGIANLSVYYGEPWSAQRAVKGVALPKAEGWQPFRVKLGQLSDGKFGQEGGAGVRLSLGTEPKLRIQLRNVRVETPTAEDLKSAGELQAEQEQRLVRNQDVLDYLGARFACQDAAARLEGNAIHFTASVTGPEEPAGDLFLAQFPIWSTPWLLMQGQNAPPASASGIQIESAASLEDDHGIWRVSLSVPRVAAGRDRLASRWALAEKTADGYRLLSPAVYLDDRSLPSKFPSDPIVVTTKKGMGGIHDHVEELVQLGVGSVTVNLTPGEFFRLEPGPGRIPFKYQNRAYYFTEKGVAKYDEIMKACAAHKIKVALIVLIQWGGPEGLDRLLPHPAASRAGAFPMPNMTTEAATDAYGAILAFLAERWGDRHGAHGYAPYWILHNEVDYGWTWTNMGETPVGVYLDTYARSMRLCSLLARQFDPDARVFISLTHNWNAPPDPKLRTYAPKQMLEMLAQFSRQEGDFDWGVAYHPYPERLFEAAAWNDQPVSFSYGTRFITPKNIEVLDAFMHEPWMRYHGAKLRPVILSEQGFNTRDYSEKSQLLQGAGLVYMFDKIRPLESIEGFQNHRWIDANEGGLLLGLRTLPDKLHPRGEKKYAWSVYQAIDTPAEAEKTRFAKSIIGISDFSEIPHKGPIEGATAGPQAH